MTNFLYRQPDLIFIHIHKTGGTSIRAALKNLQDRAGGYIPHNWPKVRSLAVTRNPVSRFLSTINMFRFGRTDIEDYYTSGQLPDLTAEQALDVLEDPAIPFDRRVSNELANLKHHLLPQTHPFNCIQHADTLLRFENLDEEFRKFCDELGMSIQLPHVGASRGEERKLRPSDLTPRDLERIAQNYRRDFEHLGYAFPTDTLPEATEPVSEDPWPTLRFHLKGKAVAARDRLPDPNADLSRFLFETVTAGPGKTWAGRARDLTEHFNQLEPEFHGRPRLAHLLACVIVVLRRDPADPAARQLFHRIVTEHGAALAGELNIRWLTSVCDTFMDVSDDAEVRATAMAGSLLANTVKLAESERRLFQPNLPGDPEIQFGRGGPLFDGMITFWVSKGDMIDNLLTRSARTLDAGGIAAPFVAEIIAKLLEFNSVWRRMIERKDKPAPTPASEDVIREIARLLGQQAP